ANCKSRNGSCSTTTASATENNGARLPSALVTTGPSARLEVNVKSVTAAGYNRPTVAKIGTACQTMGWPYSRKGDSRMKQSVKVGMLIAAPDSGETVRRPNCVSTTPPPKKIVETRARMTAVMAMDLAYRGGLANP